MMKKLMISLALIGMTSIFSNVYADGTSGCGLGTQIWEGKKGLFPHLLAATTNGTSGNQTFGMTSGTSGCKVDGAVQADQKTEVFIAVNFENLSEQMSQGKGEHLAAYGTLMGCPTEKISTFSTLTQENFDQIFTETGSAEEIISNTVKVIQGDQGLAKSCNIL